MEKWAICQVRKLEDECRLEFCWDVRVGCVIKLLRTVALSPLDVAGAPTERVEMAEGGNPQVLSLRPLNLPQWCGDVLDISPNIIKQKTQKRQCRTRQSPDFSQRQQCFSNVVHCSSIKGSDEKSRLKQGVDLRDLRRGSFLEKKTWWELKQPYALACSDVFERVGCFCR